MSEMSVYMISILTALILDFGDVSGQVRPLHDYRVRVLVAIKSGNASRRALWRASDCGSSYAAAGLKYKFFVGVPTRAGHDLSRHNQGGYDYPDERAAERLLLS